MEHKAQNELLALFRDAVKLGGAPIEMRLRRFTSLVRASDPSLAEAISPLMTGTRAALRGESLNAPVDADSRQQLLRCQYPVELDRSLVLGKEARAVAERVLHERRAGDQLAAAGLMPMRSILLSGPPGVGKTLTAAWLANQLDLPLLTLNLATVMSSFLGKTGNNVRAALDFAQQQRCVLLLDEFDAIAKRRGDDSDVGELKRLVTVLLQAVDDWSPDSLLVAATNHSELLDPAIWRRFDVTLDMTLPSLELRSELLQSRGLTKQFAEFIASLTEGQSPASLDRAVLSAKKSEVLGISSFEASILEWVTRTHDKPPQDVSQRDLQVILLRSQGKTTREIADQVQVSHTTVNRTLKKIQGVNNGAPQSADR